MIVARYYTFNSETLSYEKHSRSFTAHLRRFLLSLVSAIVLVTAAIYVYSHFFVTPRAILLNNYNANMQIKYQVLINKLRQTDRQLNDLMLRDNKVYRSIFSIDIIPTEIREQGLSNTNKYKSLLINSETFVVAEALLLMDKLMKKAYIQSESLDEIAGYARQKELMISCIPSIPPVNISDSRLRISALFGLRIDPIYRMPKMHEGIDFAGALGTPIYASGDGRVTTSRFSIHGYGNLIVVDHGFGYTTRYAHLSELNVKEGDVVKRGQIVGLMGNTGKSTGSHLHYEVLLRGKAINPINFFNDDLTVTEFEKIIDALAGRTAGLATDY
ncbi:MAG: M23 family metallopeptidase [Bacteroidales bacterium]